MRLVAREVRDEDKNWATLLHSFLTAFSPFLITSVINHCRPERRWLHPPEIAICQPKDWHSGNVLVTKSRILVYFGKLIAGREGFSFSNQNNCRLEKLQGWEAPKGDSG